MLKCGTVINIENFTDRSFLVTGMDLTCDPNLHKWGGVVFVSETDHPYLYKEKCYETHPDYKHKRAKYYRESRLSYRLKKWFVGLRPVNNWIWRRGNKESKHYFPEFRRVSYCISDTCKICLDRGKCDDYFRDEGAKLIPDYPSISELDNTRPVDSNSLKYLNRWG